MHPALLHLGPVSLPTFGFLAAIGLMLALALSLRTARLAGLDADKLWNAGLFIVFTAFVLSRLLLVAMYLHSFLTYPMLLLSVPSLTPLGVALTALAALVYLRRSGLPLRAALDAWAPCATLLWGFLALGHFAEGSDPGLPSTLPWALALPPDADRLHPIALYGACLAAILTPLLFLRLHASAARLSSAPPAVDRPSRHTHTIPRHDHPGHVAALALAAVGLGQFLLSFLRQPTPSARLFDPIQWLALGLLVAAGLLSLPVPLQQEP